MKPVADSTAQELFQELVADAVGNRATDLERFLEATVKISEEWKTTPEAVYQDVLEEKGNLSGNRFMPI